MDWWDPGQYWREVRSGNVSLGTLVATLVRSRYAALRRAIGSRKYPYLPGPLEGKTRRRGSICSRASASACVPTTT